MIPSRFHGIFGSPQSLRSTATAEDTPEALALPNETAAAHKTHNAEGSQKTGQISVDVYEQDSYIVIRAPIAGVKLADLDIEVDGKVITIRGKRTLTDDIPEDQYYAQECFWGEFSRSITLPTLVDPKKVRATFSKDSILKIIIPKEEKVKIVRINESG